MRIAFDLDGTLIECGYAFPTIKRFPRAWMKFCGMEPLREGIIDLMQYFQTQGEEIWVYTTSFRNIFYIRLLFWLHGISIAGIINQAIHNQTINNRIN